MLAVRLAYKHNGHSDPFPPERKVREVSFGISGEYDGSHAAPGFAVNLQSTLPALRAVFCARQPTSPQLVLNAGIYLPTLGFGQADPVAIFALVMSGLSLVLNVGLFVNESGLREWAMGKPAAPTAPAGHARPPANFGFGGDTAI